MPPTETVQTIVTQVATFYTHSTPLECGRANTPFSIDISPLWGVEKDEKTFPKCAKSVSSNLGYSIKLKNPIIHCSGNSNEGTIVPNRIGQAAPQINKTSFSKPSLFRSSANNSSVISLSERSGVYW